MNTEPQQPEFPENDPDQPAFDFESATNIEPATEADLDALDAAHAESDEAGQGEPTIESLQMQVADAEKRVLMAHADLENFRRRNRRDMQDQLKYAPLKVMQDVLEAVDNLQRAVESYEADANGDGLVEGVKMVAQQINTALENHGCKKIEAVGQPFDPNMHQALQMQPSDEHDANVVMQDLRSGFQLHDRVIRPSQVFVSTGPAKE